MLRWLFTGSRFLLLVAVLGCTVLSVLLIGYGAVAVWRLAADLLAGSTASRPVAYEAIRAVDVFLLAAVVHLIGLGLCELFIDHDVPVPPWLKIESIDDLKNKLLRVVVLVLAVTFLGLVLGPADSRTILESGAGLALVIAGIGYFLRVADARH